MSPRRAAALLSVLLAACGGDASPTDPTSGARLTIGADTIRLGMLQRRYEVSVRAEYDSVGPRAIRPEVHSLTPEVAYGEQGIGGLGVVGVANGTARIVATYRVPGGPVLADTLVAIVRQVVADVDVVPARFRLGVADTVSLAVFAVDSGGTRVPDAVASWRSSSPGVAAVDARGLVRTAGLGDASITASVPTFAGGTATADAPVRATATGDVASVHSGGQITCLLTVAGQPWCWGETGPNFIGPGGPGAIAAPVGGVPPFVSLDVGGFHVCGLTAEGRAYCWGGNLFGQLGAGDRSPFSGIAPRPIDGLVFRAISAGSTHTCGLTQDGDAYCWGSNDHGESGQADPIVGQTIPSPRLVPGGHVFVEISAGSRSTCALDAGGRAFCWGSNHGYKLGTDAISAGAESASPIAVEGDLTFRTIRVVQDQACAITVAGAVHCWGGWLRSLGNGNWLNLVGPTLVDETLGFVDLGTGHGESAAVSGPLCALTAAGAAYCWDVNGMPSRVQIPEPVVGISSGRDRKCAVTAEGWVYCWGNGNVGGIGTGRSAGSTTPVRITAPF